MNTEQRAVSTPIPVSASGTAAHGRRLNETALLVITCLAQFMVVLDISIVNVALPAMRHALGLSQTGTQWIVSVYTLGFAGLLLFGGRAADLFGAKPIFLIGLTGFTLASLAGGLAGNGGLLITARAVQGVAGALLTPATMTLVMTNFQEPRERTRALGAWSATMAAGGAMGAVVGGMLTQWVSWRWVLFVNVPIGAALIASAVITVPRIAGRREAGLRGLDLPGALTVTLGLTTLVYGVVSTDKHGWSSTPVLAPIVTGLTLLALFVVIQARSRFALVPLRVFRNRSLAVADLMALLIGGGMFAMWFFVSLYLQNVLGFGALNAGFGFLPGSASIILGTAMATRLLHRVGPRRLLLVGPTVAAAGLAWLSRFPAHGSYVSDVAGPLMLMSFGMGLSMTPLAMAGTARIPRHEAGLASGLINTSRQVGGAIGLAALSTIAAHVTAHYRGHDPRAALASGFAAAMLAASVLLVLAAAVASFLPGQAAVPAAAPAGDRLTAEPSAPPQHQMALQPDSSS